VTFDNKFQNHTEVMEALNTGKMSVEEAEMWLVRKQRVTDCTQCNLCHTSTQRVFGVGNPKAYVLIVGEAPSKDDDVMGLPFMDRSGNFLRKLMHEAGFRKGDVYLTNIIRCKTPERREPTKDEVGACFMHFWDQLEIIKPRLIIPLGSVALKAICSNSKRTIGGLRRDDLSAHGYHVIPTWHPNFVLGQHSALREKELLKDLKKAYKAVFSG